MSLDVSLIKDEQPVYWANITHNLGEMAEAAGIYYHLWRPEEIGITTAKELIPAIAKGLADMKQYPMNFKVHDAPNGWGTYDQFIPWIEEYLDACITNPDATISVSR